MKKTKESETKNNAILIALGLYIARIVHDSDNFFAVRKYPTACRVSYKVKDGFAKVEATDSKKIFSTRTFFVDMSNGNIHDFIHGKNGNGKRREKPSGNILG